jgi:hypothetical protein
MLWIRCGFRLKKLPGLYNLMPLTRQYLFGFTITKRIRILFNKQGTHLSRLLTSSSSLPNKDQVKRALGTVELPSTVPIKQRNLSLFIKIPDTAFCVPFVEQEKDKGNNLYKSLTPASY